MPHSFKVRESRDVTAHLNISRCGFSPGLISAGIASDCRICAMLLPMTTSVFVEVCVPSRDTVETSAGRRMQVAAVVRFATGDFLHTDCDEVRRHLKVMSHQLKKELRDTFHRLSKNPIARTPSAPFQAHSLLKTINSG